MELDYKALAFWWSVAQSTINMIALFYVWVTSRQKKNSQDIDGLKDRMTKVEIELDHIPTREQMDDIHNRITKLMESQKKMEGEQHGMSTTVNLIHSFLLNKSK